MIEKTNKNIVNILIGLFLIVLIIILPKGSYVQASKYNKDTKGKNTESKLEVKEYISLDKAMEIALKKAKDKKGQVTDFGILLIYHEPYYTIEVTTKTHLFNIKVHGITGKVLSSEKNKLGKIKVTEDKYISKLEAKIVALDKVNDPIVNITDFKVELENEKPHYLIQLINSKYKYAMKIHGETGEVFDFESEEDSKTKVNNPPVVSVKYITKEEAIKKTLEKIGRAATLDKIQFEKDDNPPKYKIKMYNKDYEYMVEVHGITGAILKFEREDD